MISLREALESADRDRRAVGHFNVSDLVGLRAVVEAARAVGVPVLIGASEGERAFLGVRQIATLVRSLREEHAQPLFLNADHTHSLAAAEEAARAGFDMILFDGSALPFDDNVRETRRAVEAIRARNPSIVVEAEVGYIGSSSTIHDRAPEGMGALTTPEEARQFVEATGIDVLAPAVGTMHGLLRAMARGEAEKRLDLERIAAIKAATGRFLTLHGGSGTNADDLRAAVRAGITIVHMNTELRLAWRRGLEQALAADPDELAPYKLLAPALEGVRGVVEARLRLFSAPGPPSR